MRVIASSIEYFILARDDPAIYAAIASGDFDVDDNIAENVLKDSLWAFDGHTVKVWPDIQELLNHEGLDVDTSIDIDIDFYPFSAPLQKGLIVGAEAELTQRRDVNFAYFRTVARVSWTHICTLHWNTKKFPDHPLSPSHPPLPSNPLRHRLRPPPQPPLPSPPLLHPRPRNPPAHRP